ncbi:hypothetical protein CUMW_275570 [Citrus unshiu]|uniref:Uncharacterized protein n=1 Tax=Citrus unshiu TaxID=55188 RepID=A0A2H5N019_CITUN|nr:hypothetical protein CUMW_275570 [Citrus unshiu]
MEETQPVNETQVREQLKTGPARARKKPGWLKDFVLTQHLGLEHIFLLERLLESIQDRHSPFRFLIAGIASAFSAFCYAELASRWPSAGSAYHYSYIYVEEGVRWLIG